MSSRWSVQIDEVEQQKLDELCRKVEFSITSFEKNISKVPSSRFRKLGDRARKLQKVLYDVQYSDWQNLKSRHDRISSLKLAANTLGDELAAAVTSSDRGTRLTFEEPLRKAGRDIQRSFRLLFELEGVVGQTLLKSDLTPGDRPAPLHVSLIADRLVLVEQRTRIGDISDASLAMLRYEASELVRNVIAELKIASNVDYRYISSLERYNRALTDDNISVEGLGIQFELASKLAASFKDELSITATESIKISLETTELILNQYEEWRRYTYEKRKKNWTEEDARDLESASLELAEEIGADSSIFDQRIKETLVRIVADFREVAATADVIAPPLIGAISNIFSRLVESVLNAAQIMSASTAILPQGSWYFIAAASLVLLNKFSKRLLRFDALRFIDNALAYLKKNYPEISKLIE